MATFDAAAAVEDLDYDFTKFITDGRADAKAILPEPSGDQIRVMREILEKTYPTKIVKRPNPLTGAEESHTELDVDEIIARSKETDKALEDETIAGISEMFSGTPSVETLHELPFRVQRAFFGFVFGVFFNPEA